jgi:hypothetical protein
VLTLSPLTLLSQEAASLLLTLLLPEPSPPAPCQGEESTCALLLTFASLLTAAPPEPPKSLLILDACKLPNLFFGFHHSVSHRPLFVTTVCHNSSLLHLCPLLPSTLPIAALVCRMFPISAPSSSDAVHTEANGRQQCSDTGSPLPKHIDLASCPSTGHRAMECSGDCLCKSRLLCNSSKVSYSLRLNGRLHV